MTQQQGHTVASLLEATAKRLAAPELGSEDPHKEAHELLAHALGILPAQLHARAKELIGHNAHNELLRLLSRRLAAEPTGYIVGAVEILGLRFKVDRRGFIPRLDLALLIHAALEGSLPGATGFALDLACGIGAAGICVASARPGLRLDLADVSVEAIELAGENADALLPGRAHLYAGDLFEPLPRERRGTYAVITANPAWVPDAAGLPAEASDHQAHVFGGSDGLDVVRRLIADLPEWLAHGGTYAQQCDPSQVGRVIALLKAAGLQETRGHADARGIERVVSARRL